MKRPAFQFYPGDWRKDTALQFCSLAARGLWIDAMCIAHECEPYGHLAVNGRPMSAAQIGRLVGISAKECERLLAELTDAGVCSRTEDGTIYSRRMVRDEDLRNRRATGGQKGAEHGQKGAEHGSKGGRPKTNEGGIENPPSDESRGDKKPPLKPPPSSSSSSSVLLSSEANASDSSPGSATAGRGELPCPYGDIVAAYGELLPMLPSVRIVTDKRKREMRKRWAWVLSSRKASGERRAHNAEEAMAWFREYFARCAADPFINGSAPRGKGHEGWEADIGFLMRDECLVRIAEKSTRTAA